MKSKLIFLTIALIVAAAFAGCGSNHAEVTDETQNHTTVSIVETSSDISLTSELNTEPVTNVNTEAENIVATSSTLQAATEDVASTASEVKPAESSTEVKYNEPQINFSDLE